MYKNVKPVAKYKAMKKQVFLEVLSEIKSEVKKYAKDPECMLKVTDPAVVTSLTNEEIDVQLQEKCPRLCLILAYVVKLGKARNNEPKKFKNCVDFRYVFTFFITKNNLLNLFWTKVSRKRRMMSMETLKTQKERNAAERIV